MLNSMYTATTAMKLNQRTMDITANNLANANTTGFKKDIPIIESFPDVLLAKINNKPDLDNHRPFTGVKVEKPEDDVYSLNINTGYFRVITPAGTSHNREIEFTTDNDGFLKTFYRDIDGNKKINDENYVIGRDGRPIRAEGGNITINPNGNVESNGRVVGNLLFFSGSEIIGTDNAGAKLDKIVTNFTEGSIIETGNNLDFAIRGTGFFKVQDEAGDIYYTRDGSFTIDRTGKLITKDGKTVLGQNGAIILAGKDIETNVEGSITLDGAIVGKFNIVEIENKEDLRKIGNNLYRAVQNGEIREAAFTGEVLSGCTESSNVDIIKEMVSMIAGFRSYESSQKVITTQDELLNKVVNDLGKV